MEALHDVVRAGKARYIGASSMYAWQFAKAQHAAAATGWTRFVSMQNHYNLVYREEEREMIPLCLDQGVGVIPWSPLARGLLAGNREPGGARRPSGRGTDPLADDAVRRATTSTSSTRCATVAERARACRRRRSRWRGCSASRAVTAPIVGATKERHLDDAIAAVDVTLSGEEVARLEAPYRPHPILGHA